MEFASGDTPDDLGVKAWVAGSTGTAADQWFDTVIGHLQDIVLDPAFEALSNGFQAQHSSIFTDAEENKLEYTPIFQAWTAAVETHLDQQLQLCVPSFTMASFLAALPSRKDQVDEELFDTLLSIGDFNAFKSMMLSANQSLHGQGLDLAIGCKKI